MNIETLQRGMELKNFSSIIFVIFFLIISQILNGKELSKHLLGFDNFIDKKFKGEFYNSTKEKPLIDVIYFERILNGEAIRISHSVNRGEYGGQYIITWNSDIERIESYYFSTGGEIRVSIVSIIDKEITIEEDFSKNKNGIQKVKKIYRINEEGFLENHIEYLINNLWVKSHEMNYAQNDSAKIIFR